MRVPPHLDRIVFVLSFGFLMGFYGFAACALGWFPSDFVIRAWNQAVAIDQPRDPGAGWTTDRVYDRAGARTVQPDRVQPGLTLIASHWAEFDWKPGLKLIDREGAVVHEWRVDPVELFPKSADRQPKINVDFDQRHIHGFYLYPNGDVLVNLEFVGTVRLDACGQVLWTLSAGSHHSITRAEDGSFWIPGSTKMKPPVSARYPDGYPGLDAAIYHDQILHVSEDGTVLDTINVLDILYANGLERYIAKAGQRTDPDVTHGNDVEPLASSMAAAFPLFAPGDLLISLRNIDLVLVFDPETLEVKWHISQPFIQQHDPDFLSDGWIGIFDNNKDGTRRGDMLGGSRILAVQPHTDSVKVIFPTERSAPLYTDIMGQWQTLANGNMLLTESLPGRVVEVAPDGRTVWEWVREPYDSASVPWVTGSDRYPVQLETARSWPCSPGEPGAR